MSRLTSSNERALDYLHGMGLRDAFDDALPEPGWAFSAYARVVVALIDLGEWQPWRLEAWRLLDDAECRRAERRRAAADRDDLALGYALHRLLLGKALGCDPSDVPLARDARGCPRLGDDVLWTSLSHAGGYVALAACAVGPVGVDIELATRAATMPEIAGRVCHPADAASIAGLLPPAWNTALLELWVRKEALLKAAGVGLEREMNSFAAAGNQVLPLSSPSGAMTQLRMLDVGPRWVAAVAAPPGIPLEHTWLRPGAT